jgi:hypothetical protein
MTNSELPDEDIDEIERRVNGATPGPWFTRVLSDEYANAITAVTTKRPKPNDPPSHFDPTEVVSITFVDNPAYATLEIRESDRNASFIAHARIDIVRLIEEIRRLRSER